MKLWSIQVQMQVEVWAETEEEACDIAVNDAMHLEPTEWATVILSQQLEKAS